MLSMSWWTDLLLPVRHLHCAIQSGVTKLAQNTVILYDVHHARHLRENQHLQSSKSNISPLQNKQIHSRQVHFIKVGQTWG